MDSPTTANDSPAATDRHDRKLGSREGNETRNSCEIAERADTCTNSEGSQIEAGQRAEQSRTARFRTTRAMTEITGIVSHTHQHGESTAYDPERVISERWRRTIMTRMVREVKERLREGTLDETEESEGYEAIGPEKCIC